MPADNRLDDLFDRIVACQLELSAGWLPTKGSAVDHFEYDSSDYPYWTNLLGAWNTSPSDTDGRTIYEHTIIMRLTLGKFTAGGQGEMEKRARKWTVETQDYIARRPSLRSVAFPVAMKFLRETVRITTSIGLAVSTNENGTKEWYTDINLVAAIAVPTPTPNF
jgi:hypothetical protein